MSKYFKGDLIEQKVYTALQPAADGMSLAKSDFFEDAYNSVPLGELLFDQMRVPLTNAIKREVFIRSFAELFQAWNFAGTFESYILVFKKIFGDNVVIDFTVPGPGQLVIDIEATDVQEFEFVSRYINDNIYVYDKVVDEGGDNILFVGVQGMETEQEIETMLFTLVPNGIYTEVSLTISPA